jgi:acetyltransferase-like isoleucine patch superfamily enzyme
MTYTKIDETTIINGNFQLISSKESKIVIGKYCAIANNFKINTLNHDYNYPCLQGTFYKNFFKKKHPGELPPITKVRTKGDVIIGNDVWVGEDVWVSSGITIGSGCVIGAKSVITKDLPPYTICCGVPCKPVKKRYSEDVVNFLLELKWWNWSNEKIKNNEKFFYLNLNNYNINEIIKIIN